MSKICIDELARGAREHDESAGRYLSARGTLALIARIRELETASRCAAVALRMYHEDSPTAKETDRIVEKGTVLP